MSGSAEERAVLRALGALIAFLIAGGLALALTRSAAGDGPAAGGGNAAGAVHGAGAPAPGTSLAAFIQDRRRTLTGLTGEAVAVVSLRSYRTAEDARALVGGGGRHVAALLVAAPGGEPAVVAGGLKGWAERQRTAARTEREALEQLLRTTEEPEFRQQFQEDIARLGALAAAVDPGGAVVYGAVVAGPADALRALLPHPEVRLVDPVARRVPDDLSSLVGVRPEETERAGFPPTRPAV